MATLVATVAVLGALLVPMLVSSPAGASPSHAAATTQCTIYPSGACGTTTSGPTTVPVISVAASVGVQASTPKSSSLAFTGTDIALLLIAAALLILLGYATVRVTKQRRQVH